MKKHKKSLSKSRRIVRKLSGKRPPARHYKGPAVRHAPGRKKRSGKGYIPPRPGRKAHPSLAGSKIKSKGAARTTKVSSQKKQVLTVSKKTLPVTRPASRRKKFTAKFGLPGKVRIPYKKVTVFFRDVKGRKTEPRRDKKVKAYFKLTGEKEKPLGRVYRKPEYKKRRDYLARVKAEAEKKVLEGYKAGAVLPKSFSIKVPGGTFSHPKKQRHVVDVAAAKFLVPTKGRLKKYEENFEYEGTSNYNQKAVMSALDLNRFYMEPKYKNVQIYYQMSFLDPEHERWATSLNFTIDNLKKDMRDDLKSEKWKPKNINTVNYIYSNVRRRLTNKGLSITPKAYKYQHEIKDQVHDLYDPTGKKVIGKVPGHVNKLVRKFRVFVKVTYEMVE